MSEIKPISLTVEHYLPGQLGINTHTPRLSWKYSEIPPTGALVLICIQRHLPGKQKQTNYVSAQIEQNQYMKWPLPPLKDREIVDVKMKILAKGYEFSWSDNLHFDVGILDKFSLIGRFVGYPEVSGETDHRPQPLVRTEFKIKARPIYARLYLTALGVVEGELNGKSISDDILSPGWTDYNNRLTCQSYDVLNQIECGNNAMGFWLGDGWYRGRTGPVGGRVNYYGDKIGVYVQLEIIDANNEQYTIYSNSFDHKWKTKMGPIVQSNIYEGEWYDQRLECQGWSVAGYDDSDWLDVAEVLSDTEKINFPENAPIRPVAIQQPIKIDSYLDGWIIDFGQNCTQKIRLNVHGLSSGDELIMEHVEVLNPDGSPAVRPLRRGIQTDHFISNGTDMQWVVKFAGHGFRYAYLKGWKGKLVLEDLDAIVYHSVMQRTGHFNCSDKMVNKLHDNTLWSMNSNFVSIPTDCPQRDERLGWTGDIALFAPTATTLYDSTAFLSNWLRDVQYERNKYGTLPVYTPYMPFAGWAVIDALAIWGDAAVLVPWAIYMESGDKNNLASHYPLSKAWIDEVIGYLSEDGIWDRKPKYDVGQLGDWLDPTAPPEEPVKAMTQKNLVATAFFIKSCQLLAQMNRELGYTQATYYQKIADHSKKGFINRFFNKKGLMTSDTQCAYALAIEFGILDGNEWLQNRAGQRLTQLITAANNTIATGFAGTPYILPALLRTGHVKTAYKLFLSDKCPSWMYQVKMGATTIWERWDSLMPNGSVNPGEMTSFNHYALGSVTKWIYDTIGGLAPLKPGWKEFQISPRPGGGIKYATASHETRNGLAEVRWECSEKEMSLNVLVPFNTVGIIQFTDGTQKKLNSGKYYLKYRVDNFI